MGLFRGNVLSPHPLPNLPLERGGTLRKGDFGGYRVRRVVTFHEWLRHNLKVSLRRNKPLAAT
jgi:hypothetical protein